MPKVHNGARFAQQHAGNCNLFCYCPACKYLVSIAGAVGGLPLEAAGTEAHVAPFVLQWTQQLDGEGWWSDTASGWHGTYA